LGIQIAPPARRSQSQAVSKPTQRSGSIGMMALMIRRSVPQRRVTRLRIEPLGRSTVKLSAERDRRRARCRSVLRRSAHLGEQVRLLEMRAMNAAPQSEQERGSPPDSFCKAWVDLYLASNRWLKLERAVCRLDTSRACQILTPPPPSAEKPSPQKPSLGDRDRTRRGDSARGHDVARQRNGDETGSGAASICHLLASYSRLREKTVARRKGF